MHSNTLDELLCVGSIKKMTVFQNLRNYINRFLLKTLGVGFKTLILKIRLSKGQNPTPNTKVLVQLL